MTSALASRLLQDGLDMHRRGSVTAAADRYSQILKFEPKNVDALCLLGVAYGELGRSAEAVKFFRKAIKVAPKHAAAHNLLGAALKQLGRTDEALASFERAISQQPDFMDAYLARADLLMALNRPAEAVGTYDRALAIRPSFFQGWCNRGVALGSIRRASAVRRIGIVGLGKMGHPMARHLARAKFDVEAKILPTSTMREASESG